MIEDMHKESTTLEMHRGHRLPRRAISAADS